MTHLSPADAVRRGSPPASRPPWPALFGDHTRLCQALAGRRAIITALEAAWVAAAETDAARHAGRDVRVDDRSTWDRATWDRYLAAACRHEPDFKPRIMRLLCEVESLERLLSMPCGAKRHDRAQLELSRSSAARPSASRASTGVTDTISQVKSASCC